MRGVAICDAGDWIDVYVCKTSTLTPISSFAFEWGEESSHGGV